MPDPSFDVVSELDVQEIRNAVDQAQREIAQRYDFKGTGTDITLAGETITLASANDARLEAAYVVLQEKLVKRQVSMKVLDPQKVQPASGGSVRQEVNLVAGINKDNAKLVTKLVKDLGLKVQAQVQQDRVRITGKKKDDLQSAINAIKDADLPFPVQFTNYR